MSDPKARREGMKGQIWTRNSPLVLLRQEPEGKDKCAYRYNFVKLMCGCVDRKGRKLPVVFLLTL